MINTPLVLDSTAESIHVAALALKAGHLVAFPTETVYGLGADARNPEAIEKIYQVKGRPIGHPLIVHISSLNKLQKWAVDIPEYALRLANEFWPGPLTLILKRNGIAKDFITGGQDTIGLRVPSDPIAMALIVEFEKISDSAIAAPSANRFGQVSPTTSRHVQKEVGAFLSRYDVILKGKDLQFGIESTIIDCTNKIPSIRREGAITREAIQKITTVEEGFFDGQKYSGSFEKHYSPKAKVEVGSTPGPNEGFIALSHTVTPSGVCRLSSPANPDEFARELYSALHHADDLGIERIWIELPLEEGIGRAIADRVRKASAGRSNTDEG
jgi:L-threonylcarbamoyladenylate synthase